jgi:hypothetical protein
LCSLTALPPTLSEPGKDGIAKELVRPLAVALQGKSVTVWYDEFSLKLGDSLRASVDYGSSELTVRCRGSEQEFLCKTLAGAGS